MGSVHEEIPWIFASKESIKFRGILYQKRMVLSGGWCYVTENNELILEGRCKEIIQVFDRKLYSAETENVI